MTMEPSSTEGRLRRVFERTIGLDSGVKTIATTVTPEWDSLSHIKLIIALEVEFEISISPRDILKLYGDFDVVLDYVNAAVEES